MHGKEVFGFHCHPKSHADYGGANPLNAVCSNFSQDRRLS